MQNDRVAMTDRWTEEARRLLASMDGPAVPPRSAVDAIAAALEAAHAEGEAERDRLRAEVARLDEQNALYESRATTLTEYLTDSQNEADALRAELEAARAVVEASEALAKAKWSAGEGDAWQALEAALARYDAAIASSDTAASGEHDGRDAR